MFQKSRLSMAIATLLGGGLLLSQPAVRADDGGGQKLERVEVTGSSIRRTDAETPSPVQVITAEEMHAQGYTSIQDVLHNITANGAGTLSQGFSLAFASGAGGVSLRGLTTGATLVLIDGHRMAPYPLGDDGQRAFVDVSNIPFETIERIEILKDGASAIYGSDAMAGVVNIILKKSFVGKTVTVDYGISGHGDGQTTHVSGMAGFGDLNVDGHNFYIAGEIRTQKQITFGDRGGMYTQQDYSANGGNNLTGGVISAANPLPASNTGYITNNSGSIIGYMPGCSATLMAQGKCAFNTQSNMQIQPPTDNYNFVGNYTQKLDDGWKLKLQGTYFESKSQQINPAASTFPSGFSGLAYHAGIVPTPQTPLLPTTITSANPSFPSGTGATSGYLYYNFQNALGMATANTDSRATRMIADLSGNLGEWDFKSSVGLTEVQLGLTDLNYVNPGNLQIALNGSTPLGYYLVGGTNSAAMNNYIAPAMQANDTSKLYFAHADANRELVQLEGGALSLAIGTDVYYRSLNAVAPDAIANGSTPGNNAFAQGTQQVASVYTELLAPITKDFEADGALRYDHYNISGGHFSPKTGFKYSVLPELAFRGTASGGFRAPGPAENGTAGQSFYSGTTTDSVLCPTPSNRNAGGNYPTTCNFNLPQVNSTNPALKPETSKSFTLGTIFEPSKSFSATLDLYSIEIDNQIIPGPPGDPVRSTNLSPISYCPASYGATGCTPAQLITQAPPVGKILYAPAPYINANSTRTNGLELAFNYNQKITDTTTWASRFDTSYIHSFELTTGGQTYQLAGTHGPLTVGGDTGNPKMRMQWSNKLTDGPLQVTGTINYISSYGVTDPSVGLGNCADAIAYQGGAGSVYYGNYIAGHGLPANISCHVGSFTTFDVYARYQYDKGLSLHGSIMNLFNRQAPEDWATYASNGAAPYNPSLHSAGAIGRYFSVGATYIFD